MLLLYNLLGWVVLVACLPYLVKQWFHDRREVRERLGFVPRVSGCGPVIWFHAASVGEVGALQPILKEAMRVAPRTHFVVSTMTATGQRKARDSLSGTQEVFFFPADLGVFQSRALGRVGPSVILLTETELWPNLIMLARKSGCRVVVVNGRMSDRSFPRYYRFRRWLRPVVTQVDLWAMQTVRDRERVLALGVDPSRAFVAGNSKFDLTPDPDPRLRELVRRELGVPEGATVLVAGSTRAGEEEIILEALEEASGKLQGLKVILAPRHPERFEDVARLLEGRSIRFRRRSPRIRAEEGGDTTWSVFLLDTIGELLRMYAAADIAFVGGSLVPCGGHNPLEPAAYGVPVLFGPHMDNAREAADLLLKSGGGGTVTDKRGLAAMLGHLSDVTTRRTIGFAAKEVLDSNRGVARRIVDSLVERGILPPT